MGHQDYTYYGRVAFEAIKLHCGGVDAGDGEPIPEWDELSVDTQQGWIVVGEAVVNAYTGE